MNSGNGVEATQGADPHRGRHARPGARGLRDGHPDDPLVNAGAEPDALAYATINGHAGLRSPRVPASSLPGASISFGYESDAWINSYDLDVPPSTYVPVELGFEKAGLVKHLAS